MLVRLSPNTSGLGVVGVDVAAFPAQPHLGGHAREGLEVSRRLLAPVHAAFGGHLRFLFRVAVPISRPIIGSFVLISFLAAWNQYVWPRFAADEESWQTIQVALRTFGQREVDQLNFGFAAAILSALPLACTSMEAPPEPSGKAPAEAPPTEPTPTPTDPTKKRRGRSQRPRRHPVLLHAPVPRSITLSRTCPGGDATGGGASVARVASSGVQRWSRQNLSRGG